MHRPIRSILTVATVLALGALASSAWAQTSLKIGVFDSQRISEETLEGKRIQTDLGGLRDAKQAEITGQEQAHRRTAAAAQPAGTVALRGHARRAGAGHPAPGPGAEQRPGPGDPRAATRGGGRGGPLQREAGRGRQPLRAGRELRPVARAGRDRLGREFGGRDHGDHRPLRSDVPRREPLIPVEGRVRTTLSATRVSCRLREVAPRPAGPGACAGRST